MENEKHEECLEHASACSTSVCAGAASLVLSENTSVLKGRLVQEGKPYADCPET